jgi:CheY-like chemotaxis protein
VSEEAAAVIRSANRFGKSLHFGSHQQSGPNMLRNQPAAPSRILIADDNHQNCELLDAYLSDQSYKIEMVHDGQQALDAISRAQPDLLLLDIMMPKVSGYEVCQRLKSNPQTRDIPVIMVTALTEMGDIEKAVNAGADDFLTKPVNKLELTTRVKSLLRVRHLTNERDRLLAYLAAVEATREPEEPRPARTRATERGARSAERGARN